MKTKITSMILTTFLLGSLLSGCASSEEPKDQEQTSQESTINPGTSPNEEAGKDTETEAGTKEDNSDKDTDENSKSTPTVKEMVDAMLSKVEEPSLMELGDDQIKDFYNIDPAMLEEYSVRIPLMNVKTNEVSLLKVKNEKDLDAIKEGLRLRAEAVQKQFEHYLQDQYENAKNYRIIVNGNYVLFLITDNADELETAFTSFFNN